MTNVRIVFGEPVRVGELRDVRAVSVTVRAVGVVQSLVLKNNGEDIVEVGVALEAEYGHVVRDSQLRNSQGAEDEQRNS